MSYKSAKQRYPSPSVQLLQTIVNLSHRKKCCHCWIWIWI